MLPIPAKAVILLDGNFPITKKSVLSSAFLNQLKPPY